MIVFGIIYLLRVNKMASASWWNDSWAYKKMITIDHDKVGIASDMGANASSGQKNVTVKDGTLFTAGETVVIKDSVSRETNTVASVAGNVVTMQNNLANNYTTANSAFVKNTTDSVDLVDFPILINLDSDSSLASYARSDAYDISFISSNDSTQLKHEIESYTSATGALVAWVKVPTLSTSADTVIYMYYGNATADDQSDKTNVWDEDFAGVWHKNDLTTSTIADSTMNGNTGTKVSANNPLQIAGKIGNAQVYDGNDYITITNTTIQTASLWVNLNSVTSNQYFLGGGNTQGVRYNGTSFLVYNGSAGYVALNWTKEDNWKYITVTKVNSNDYNFYVDGNLLGVVTAGTNGADIGITLFGKRSNGSYYTGPIDEVRISNSIRLNDWVATEYKNQNSPSTFYILGSVEEKPVVSGLTASSTIFMGGSTSTTLLPPILYYNFDEGYATTTYNYVSSTPNGIITGASWTNDGKFGKALSFAGGTNNVSISNIPVNTSAGAKHTVTFWMKWSGTNNGMPFSWTNYDLWFYGSCFGFNTYSSNVYGINSSSLANRWVHVAAVFDNSPSNPSTLEMYIDGIKQNLSLCSGSHTPRTVSSNAIIGKGFDSYAYVGLIDEFKIYKYALNSDQVKLDYNNGMAMILGRSGTSTSASSEYCVPGDTSYCASPVAEYKFDEKIGTVANDTSGNNNIGSITGATWVRGKIGSALTFDNVDDGVNIANENFTSLTDYTMSAWINIKGTHKHYTGVIISSGNWNGNHWAFGISQNNAQVQFKKPDGTTWYAKAYSFSLNRWYKVDAVRSGINLYYYVNGQSIGTSTIGSGNIVSDASNTTIGRETYASGYFDFNGSIDDVKIYNYARTPAQVAWDYNKGAPIAHYKFDECSGEIVHDNSGNGNDGAITIGATGVQSAVGTCTDDDTTHAWYNGRTGKYKASLNFDGSDDYVYGASNLGISGDAEFTMCAWVYWAGDNWSSNYPSFMGNNSTGVTNQGLSFTVNSGRPAIDFWVNRFRATNALSVKTWYHICGTKTPGIIGSTSKIYVDSKLVSGAVEGTNTTPNITNSVSIIGRLDATRWFNGKIDDAKFFNYALTSEQVKLEYSGSALKFN